MANAIMIECPDCGGAGGFSEDCADSRGEHTTRDTACETCQGEGEIEAAADVEFVPTMCPLCKGDGKNVDPNDGELTDCTRCAGSGHIAVPAGEST
jgi:DnaJ-class molecular chaperone